jgi:hypothetical protein
MRFLFIIIFSLLSCSSGREFRKNPVDEIIRDLKSEKTFTIILHDMDVDGSFFKKYKHKYEIITEKGDEPKSEITAWTEVPEDFFFKNENNMGMELASRGEDGKLNKSVAPAGYGNYVGNPKYGQWTQSGGSSFWEFYGKYAFLSSMFGMFSPPYRSYYDDYHRSYRYNRKPYYGPKKNGRSLYGTYGRAMEKNRPNVFKRKMNKIKSKSRSFSQRVKNRVNRSTKQSRSNSRWRSSSFRSRSGGFGK